MKHKLSERQKPQAFYGEEKDCGTAASRQLPHVAQSIHAAILASGKSTMITIVFRTYGILSHRNQDSTQILSYFGVQFGTTLDLVCPACFGKVGPPKNLIGQVLVQAQRKYKHLKNANQCPAWHPRTDK